MRRVVVACAVLYACTRTPDANHPIAQALYEVAHASERERVDANAALDRLAAQVDAAQKRGADRASALNRTVFERAGFVREVEERDLGYVFLPSVLAKKRGNCVGLGSLYLALGERLGLAIAGVMVPGHFFVRLEDRGRTHNLELLRRGEDMPDAWYEARFPIAGGSAPEYGRSLRLAEVIGVIEYDVGDDRKQKGRLREARDAYTKAREHFPDFAEAHASLGAIDHLLGALDDAARSYQAARKVNPNLPGLSQNIDLLDAERSAH